MAGRIFIGTSGWNYDSWRDSFYEGRPAKEWLRFCAERFSAIEVNATFYRLQSAGTFRRWRAQHVIEFRHASWFDEAVAACLREYNIAICQSDAADWPLWDCVTAGVVYVRLHGHEVTYASSYSEAALRGWARKVRRWSAEGRDVHVYFDNDAYCAAPFNALRLIALTSETS